MSWFQKFCRNAGLMVHGIKQPIKQDRAQRGTKEVVRHEVEEEQLDEHVTLRRTTIEEIETRRGINPDKLKPAPIKADGEVAPSPPNDPPDQNKNNTEPKP